MKNNVKIYSFLHFSVLCCFIISICSTTILRADPGSLSVKSGVEKNYYSIAPSNLFFPSTKTENIVYGGGSNSTISEKNTQNEFSFCSKEAEILLFCSFLEHFDFFRKFVLPFQSTDIIYPFHYFW
jgi:hypothetical protein